MTAGVRKPGAFCWFNMLTPDLPASKAFYTAIFGWTYFDLPEMGGAIAKVDGLDVGGVWDLNSPNTPKGTPPLIGVMVKAESADAVAAKATALGGRAKPPFDIATNGRMGECFDPTGAQLDIWQPINQPGMQADDSHHGVPSWFELMTPDARAAGAFYTGLFGWTAESQDMGGFSYTHFALDGVPIAGMMELGADMAGVPPHWGTYFTVDDTDATLAKATALGAKVFIPARDIPGTGRFAGLISPQGVRFYVIEYRK